ncbi:hypothetical protein K7X08_008290 [Anisodus acutangulus]|uniref:Uncharacterized protein n=1 Tax=Anisodus acutangulus TaxID=402998 RepID=A0A9Q1RNQ3_9SOLA|nr:hypothetical protein K7X08_008290 [Anisodus acutangulus]
MDVFFRTGDVVLGSLPLKMDGFHFDEIIKIRKVDADGKKYDKVSRIDAESNDGETSIQLDINSELYPMQRKEVVYVSFGRLQLMLKSDPLKTQKFKLDQKLFLLLRKMVK